MTIKKETLSVSTFSFCSEFSQIDLNDNFTINLKTAEFLNRKSKHLSTEVSQALASNLKILDLQLSLEGV